MSDTLNQFLSLRTIRDLARLLDIPPQKLAYYIFRAPQEKQQYRIFQVPKRSGEEKRQIAAPITPLKLIQQRLNEVLTHVYIALWLDKCPAVHGFIPERSILTNAQKHAHRQVILNVDIQDFFPSITAGRIYKLFMKRPYELPHQVAQAITYICCYDKCLPQGAPSSPILSNLICVRMDRELQRFAQRENLRYTRYADDMTFSSARWLNPDERNHIELGIRRIIGENYFSPHPKKVRWRVIVQGVGKRAGAGCPAQ